MSRSASTLHAEDDDYGQANTLINRVMDESQRERLVKKRRWRAQRYQTTRDPGHPLDQGPAGQVDRHQEPGGVVRTRAFDYWDNIDPKIGDRIELATNTFHAR